jgi:hypothetical protein
MEEVPMAEDPKRKRGFFGRLLRFAFLAAAIGAVVSAVRRRDGLDLDEDEWQELPPPPSA